MKELIKKIGAEFESFQIDAHLQSDKKNKSAGMRARKSAMELSKLLKEFRKASVNFSKK